MGKGIIYLMSTAVDGIIKIGKTDNFERRMRQLEKNGYNNINVLKRQFAIEVDDYDIKEALLKDLFSKSQIDNSELFAVDIDLVKQLLSAFEGTVIYPNQRKEVIFTNATDALLEKEETRIVHRFKKVNFASSLTGNAYYIATNDLGVLGVYDCDTGVEVPNHSKPSKRQILLQACKDLDIDVTEANTLYQLARKLTRHYS